MFSGSQRVERTSNHSRPQTYPQSNSHNASNRGVQSRPALPPSHMPPSHAAASSGGSGVNFTSASAHVHDPLEKLKQRERIITVRYGAHQMKLIRKRLAVEEWLDTQLKTLYNCVSSHTLFFFQCDIMHSFCKVKSLFLSQI